MKSEREKYVAFWEINLDKIQVIRKKATKLRELLNSFPWEYPKSLLGPYSWEGENRGIQIFEVSDPQQLDNLVEYWSPLVKINFQPIVDTRIWENGNNIKEYRDETSQIII